MATKKPNSVESPYTTITTTQPNPNKISTVVETLTAPAINKSVATNTVAESPYASNLATDEKSLSTQAASTPGNISVLKHLL